MNADGFYRRELFRILGGAMAAEALDAQHAHKDLAAGGSARNADPRFFTKAEYGLVDALSDMLIPADDQSAGAHEAQVRWFIDTVLFYADNER